MILAPHLMHTRGWFNELGQFLDQAIRHFDAPGRPFRVYENEGGWTLEIEAPGVDKENLKLEVRDRALHLEVGDSDSRRLPLGRQIDLTAVSAQLQDGVLRIRLPKADASTETRKIEIH